MADDAEGDGVPTQGRRKASASAHPPRSEMYRRARVTKQLLIDLANPNELAQSARIAAPSRAVEHDVGHRAVLAHRLGLQLAPVDGLPAEIVGGADPQHRERLRAQRA